MNQDVCGIYIATTIKKSNNNILPNNLQLLNSSGNSEQWVIKASLTRFC